MKVTFDATAFAMQRYGGVSRYIVELIRHLGRIEDTRVSLFAGVYLSAYPLESLRSESTEISGIRRPPWRGIGRALLALNDAAFSAMRPKTDVHHHSYYNKTRAQSHASVVTVYDMIHERFPNDFPSTDRTAQLKRRSVQEADGIVCISQSTQRDLCDALGIDRSRTRVIPLAAARLPAHLPASLHSRPYVLYVGQRRGYKNFRILYESFIETPQLSAEMDLVCFGGEAEPEIRSPSWLKFFRGNDQILSTLYNYALCFVYPSLYEGFGLPLVEAMQAGCPVIAANNSSIPEVGGDAPLYFQADRPDQLIDSIVRIANDQRLRQEMVERGRRQAAQFSWERTARESRDFYALLCGS